MRSSMISSLTCILSGQVAGNQAPSKENIDPVNSGLCNMDLHLAPPSSQEVSKFYTIKPCQFLPPDQCRRSSRPQDEDVDGRRRDIVRPPIVPGGSAVVKLRPSTVRLDSAVPRIWVSHASCCNGPK